MNNTKSKSGQSYTNLGTAVSLVPFVAISTANTYDGYGGNVARLWSARQVRISVKAALQCHCVVAGFKVVVKRRDDLETSGYFDISRERRRI